MDYSESYKSYLSIIEERIDNYVGIKEPICLYEPYRYILKGGGKRIRPVLAMIACEAVGGKPQDAVDAGVAMEILHNFTLVHDDIMDRAPMRRGRVTIHEKWNESVAIITGDMMVGHAYMLLPKGSDHPRSREIMELFSNALIEVCEGQGLDMLFNEKKGIVPEDYLLMVEKKTSRLLETAALMGAQIGLASEDELAAIKEIMFNTGIAFQIQDDLLDLTADEEKFGKKIGKDIVEGKKTLIMIKAKELTTGGDKELIDKFYNENGLGFDYVPRVKAILEKYGILEYCAGESDKYFAKAKTYLPKLKQNDGTRLLEWLVDSLNQRCY